MNSSKTPQAETLLAGDRLAEAITQAEMLCSLEGEQSEVCQLAQAYVEALRSEALSQAAK